MISTFPISHLRNFLFCERIPFFRETLAVSVEGPKWTHAGSESHQGFIKKISRRKLIDSYGKSPIEVKSNYEVYSINIGLHGVADHILIYPDGFYVGEVKPRVVNEQKLSSGWILQSFGYGLCTEESLNLRFLGVVFFSYSSASEGMKTKWIYATPRMIEWSRVKIEEFKKTMQLGLLPNAVAPI